MGWCLRPGLVLLWLRLGWGLRLGGLHLRAAAEGRRLVVEPGPKAL